MPELNGPDFMAREAAYRRIAFPTSPQGPPPEERGDAYEGPKAPANGQQAAPRAPEGPFEAPIPEQAPWPEPLDEGALFGLGGEVVRAIDPQTEADPVAILIQFLVAFGNMVGRSAFRPVGPARHYGNIFACLVGPTAKARKGTAWRWVATLLEDIDSDWASGRVLSGLSSGEGLIHVLRDEGETRTDRRVLVVEEEFAAVLRVASRDGNTLSAVLRQGWDGGRLNVMTRNNPLSATDAHLSIIGHVTREELAAQLSKTDTANGFANRFLWAAARRSKLLPDGGEAPGLGTLKPYLRDAADHAASVELMGRDHAARDLWHAEYARLSADRPGAIGLVTSRAEAQVLRLSLLYALLDCSRMVREPHLRAALALWDYCDRSCVWVFGDNTGNRDADEILDMLRVSPDGLSRTDISALFGRNRSTMQIARALGALRDMRLAHATKVATPGRPAERWFAGPQGTK